MREFLNKYIRELSKYNRYFVYESEIKEFIEGYMTMYEEDYDAFVREIYKNLKEYKMIELSREFNSLIIKQVSKSSSFK